MEIPIRYWQVENEVKPHCLRCGKNYKVDYPHDTCSEMFGVGKNRRMCEGRIVNDIYLDWSINLLKDYSIIEHGSLDFFNDCWDKIQTKIDKSKNSLDPSEKKINVTKELEMVMRLKGINMINLIAQHGDLISKSVYILGPGKSKISNYGIEDLRRFEKVKEMTGEKESSYTGYMSFTELADGEDIKKDEEPIDNTPEKDESLICKTCGFEAKSKIGLIAHLRSHEKEITKDLKDK
jgi:hypothetical protein